MCNQLWPTEDGSSLYPQMLKLNLSINKSTVEWISHYTYCYWHVQFEIEMIGEWTHVFVSCGLLSVQLPQQTHAAKIQQ